MRCVVLAMAVLIGAGGSACGSAPSASSAPSRVGKVTTTAAASASPATTPAGRSATGAGAPPTSESSTSSTSSTSSASTATFTACPANLTPAAGEPPASENGAPGACAAAAIVYPASGFACRPPPGGTYAATTTCPFDAKVAQRLDNYHSGSGGGADPLCRCQNTYQPPTYRVEKSPDPSQPATYIVRVTLPFGTSQVSLDVQVEAVPSGSLVNDIRCAGRDAATSILATSLASC